MKQSKQWKSWELEVAKDLGGKRSGPLGFNVPDVSGLYRGFAPECKYMKRLALRSADLEQAEYNARGNEWSLFLRESFSGRRYVVVPYKTFLKLWDAHTKEDNNE